MLTRDQVNASSITKLTSWFKFLGKNLHLMDCATVWDKSEVMLLWAIYTEWSQKVSSVKNQFYNHFHSMTYEQSCSITFKMHGKKWEGRLLLFVCLFVSLVSHKWFQEPYISNILQEIVSKFFLQWRINNLAQLHLRRIQRSGKAGFCNLFVF